SGQFLLELDAADVAERADAVMEAGSGEAAEVAERDPAATEAAAMIESAPAIEKSGRGARTKSRRPVAMAEAPALTAEHWFHIAVELEAHSPLEARQAYLQALDVD